MSEEIVKSSEGKLNTGSTEDFDLVFDDGRIEALGEFISPEELFKDLISRVRKYHPSDDISMIEKAYRVANEAHAGQVRKSGEPYIIHPLYVAIILADLEMDKETICAGILHDVVEDTIFTKEEIEAEFGPDVALLVDGVTKLKSFHMTEPSESVSQDKEKLEIQAENLRKMFLAMAKDIRVILIKLADRLHNMRTLGHMPPEKQQRIARETLDIYSPIADRLGISKQVMNKIIKGSKAININELAQIAETLNVSADYLLTAKDEPTREEALSFMGKIKDNETVEKINIIRSAIDEIHMLEELLDE